MEGATSSASSNKRIKASALPEEIVEEILSRLPAKPLRRFQCVSRPWRDLIASPSFRDLHSSKLAGARRRLFVRPAGFCEPLQGVRRGPERRRPGDRILTGWRRARRWPVPHRGVVRREPRVGGPHKRRDHLTAGAWYSVLSRLPARTVGRFNQVCKGWRAMIKTECFVDSHLLYHQANQSSSSTSPKVMFTDGKPNSFKSLEDLIGTSDGAPPLVDGSSRAVCSKPCHGLNGGSFMCYDFVCNPATDYYKGSDECVSIVELQGQLCMVCSHPRKGTLEIWAMKDNGRRWSMEYYVEAGRFSPEYSSELVTPIAVDSKDGRLLLSTGKVLGYYDPKTAKMETVYSLGKQIKNKKFVPILFQESLIDPCDRVF
ncbi:unnamed protein product [Urochloa decumbens]|uniref:F-box domain-containing protein n=1 Tax=Urochloa decumbens TaxID=240449 RepID=A0ABC8WYR7_9POAL